MAQEAPNWFTEEYIAGVIHLFQNEGNLTRNMVREGKVESATSGYFRLAGKGTATKIIRTGNPSEAVPMNAGRTKVKCDIDNYQAAEWIWDPDLDKMDIDERQEAQRTAAMALGRKFDEVLFATLDAGATGYGTIVGSAAAAWTIQNAITACRNMQQRDVPWDGNVFCVLPATAWNQMMTYQQFSNSQWTDEKTLSMGVTSKFWNNVHWVLGYESLFSTPSGTGRRFYMWHKSSVGALWNKEVQSKITWENPKTAWFANNWAGFGAKVLLGSTTGGIIECAVQNDSAIP